MESALYSFYSLVVCIIKLTRSLRSLVRFMILHHSWIKTVRAHFPCSILYVLYKYENIFHIGGANNLWEINFFPQRRQYNVESPAQNCNLFCIAIFSIFSEPVIVLYIKSLSLIEMFTVWRFYFILLKSKSYDYKSFTFFAVADHPPLSRPGRRR